MEDFILELANMRIFLDGGQIGGHGLDLPINFLFNFQQLLLFLQLQCPLFLRLKLFEQFGLAALLVFEVVRENGVTGDYIYLFAHY